VSNTPPVAIVDDDSSVRRSLSRLLTAVGYPVDTFASARDFLEWVPDHRTACVMLDIHMPEMTGFELQERLTIPVIFMTAHDNAATRARIKKSGAAGHLWKPFDEEAVVDAIRTAVGGRGPQGA
jgi:FixJ family two-component response regulator